MMAATAIEIAPGAGSGGQQARSAPQVLAARQSLRDRWDAVFGLLRDTEAPLESSAGLQPPIQFDDSPFRGTTNLARQNAALAGLKSNAEPNASRQKNEEKSAAAIEPASNWPGRASILTPISASAVIFAEDGNALPAAPLAFSAQRAKAGSGAADHGSGDSKNPAQPSAPLDLAAVSANASIVVPSPLSSAPSVAAKSAPAANTAASCPGFPGTGISGLAGFGVRSASFSMHGSLAHGSLAEGVPVSAGLAVPGDPAAPLIVSSESEAAAISDQGRSAIGAEQVHAGESAKPLLRGTDSQASPLGAVSAPTASPAKTDELKIPLIANAQSGDSSSSAHTDAAAPVQMLAAHETAAKAKSRGAGEGISGEGTVIASGALLAAGGPGSHAASFVARETGSVPVSSQSAAQPGNAPASTSKDAFAALDGAVAGAAPAWVHAGATRAEAGFEDPALGWVGVRAELGNGGVHASIVPGSTDAALELGSHLAGLNAYLAEHHAGVSMVTLSGAEGRSIDAGAGAAQQEFGRPTQQGSGERQEANSRGGAPASGASDAAEAAPRSMISLGVTHAGAWMERGAGVHISVLA